MSTVPVDPVVEVLIDGAWRDVTADVRLASADSGGGITIERGRANEAPTVEPTQIGFTLNNGESKAAETLGEVSVYSPRNAVGPWFGQLGRNQPVRVGMARRSDDFNRTVVDGWGNLPVHVLPDRTNAPTQSWTLATTTAAAFDISPGAATIQTVSGTRMATVGTYADVEVLTKLKVSNRLCEFGIVLRKKPGVSEWYSAYVKPGTPDEIRIGKVYNAGASARSVNGNLGFSIVANTWYWMKAQMRGQRLRVKVWADGSAEPFLWTWRYYDSEQVDEAPLPMYGAVGILGAAGISQITVASIEINQWRAYGEIAKLPSRYDLSRQDRWVPIQARGLLRRLGQGRKALKSAVTRHLSSYTTSKGWLQLEETTGSTTTTNTAAPNHPGLISGLTFNAADTVAIPGIGGYVTLSENTSSILLAISGHTAPGAQTLLWFMQVTSAPASDILLNTIRATGSVFKQYRIYLQSDSTIRVDCINDAGAVADTISGFSLYGTTDVPYGAWIAITLYCFDSGGNVNWAANWHRIGSDSFFTTGTQVLAGSVGVFQSSLMGSSAVHVSSGISVAHLFHYPGDLPFVTTAFARAAYAYIEELAATRFLRLTSEHGIRGTTIGLSTTSAPMGPQLPAKLVDLLGECAEAEEGILQEERDELGLVITTRFALLNQLAVSMDLDDGHLTEPLDPSDDDQGTRNHVTVSRPNGRSFTSIQTEGPLNVNEPEDDPDGVGIYDEGPELSLAFDYQLAPAANWRRSRGTQPDARYPSMTADLTSAAYLDDAAMAAMAASLDAGRIIDLMNTEVDSVASEQVIQSYVEKMDQYDWTITWVTTPGGLYRVGVVEYTTRLATDYLVVESDFDAGVDTAMTTERTDATKGLWVLPADSAASFPFQIDVSGVRLIVTSASGTSDPQTLTITQAPVNGIIKTIPAGSPIQVVGAWRLAR